MSLWQFLKSCVKGVFFTLVLAGNPEVKSTQAFYNLIFMVFFGSHSVNLGLKSSVESGDLFTFLFNILILLPRATVQLKKALTFNAILPWLG